MQEIVGTEKRFGLMDERERADVDDEVVWSRLVDELSGCDIALEVASLRFDQLVKLGRR